MKKSNKLLLGGFLTVIALVTGIHIALFAKYKNGDYIIYHPDDKRGGDRMHSFPNVSLVVLRNVSGATLQFGDTAQVEKGKEDVVAYVQKGDSLVITGQYNGYEIDGRRLVNITVPHNTTISAVNSFLYFEKSEEDEKNNTAIYLQRSHAVFSKSTSPFLLGQIKLIASDSSTAAFHGNTRVDQLEVQLSNSALEYNEGEAGQLSVVTDSISRLSLQFKHLLKAKITTIPNNP